MREDLRQALRSLSRSPGFTLVAIATLAAGIGASAALFSVVNAVLLRPLPYVEPERLVMVWDRVTRLGLDRNGVSPSNFVDWRRLSSVFESMDAYTETFVNLAGDDGPPERVDGMAVTPGFFDTLGVRPLVGRSFHRDDAQPGADAGPRPILISHGIWQQRLGGIRDILGRTLVVNGGRCEIVGVLPPEFLFVGKRFDVFNTFAFSEEQTRNRRGRRWLTVVARMKPGVGVARAQAEMDSVTVRLAEQYPDVNRGRGAQVRLLECQLLGSVRHGLLLLQAAVALMLLIAAGNVANLQLVRSLSRARELATRAAMGATRRRLLRQLLAEGVLLAAGGGAIGVLFAAWGTRLLVTLSPADVPRITDTRVDVSVLAFSLLLAAAVSVVCGLLPALSASRADLRGVLSEGGRSHTAGGRSRLQGVFVTVQVALSLVLLVGAGLLVKSFIRLQRVDPGFVQDAAVAMDISLGAVHGDLPARARVYEQLIERVQAMPGVRFAGITSDLPLSGETSRRSFSLVAESSALASEKLDAEIRRVSSRYFDAMGLTLRSGRGFGTTETGVVVVNEAFARRFLVGQDPRGRELVIDDGPPLRREIVGVVGDVKHFGLDAATPPEIYLSHLDRPWPSMTLVVRAAVGRPIALVPGVRRELAALDKDLPAANVKTIEQYLAGSVAQRRLSMRLLGAFGSVALLLAALGIYGVVADAVSRRSAEIAIRMALGADGRDVTRMVVRDCLRRVQVGLAAGLAGSWILSRGMSGLLYEVTPLDPGVFTTAAVTLVAAALLACWLPARQAARTAPMSCLRA